MIFKIFPLGGLINRLRMCL